MNRAERPRTTRQALAPPAISWLAIIFAVLYFCGCTLIYLLLPQLAHISIPLISNDSPGYVSWAPYRDAGYPLIIMAARFLGLGVDAIPYLQMATASIALVSLYGASSEAFHSKARGASLVAAIALNPYLVSFHFMIASESFFVSFQILFVAEIIRFATNRQLRSMAAASIFAACTVLVRAAGWSLVPMLPLALVFLVPSVRTFRTLWRTCACAMLLPFACLFTAAVLYQHHYFGENYTTSAPRNLYSKSLLFAAGVSPYPKGSVEDRLWNNIEADSSTVRAFLDAQPSWVVRRDWNAFYQSYFTSWYERRHAVPLVQAEGHATRMAATEKVILRVALARIAAAPAAYLRQSLWDYGLQWMPTSYALDYPGFLKLWTHYVPPPLTTLADASLFRPEPIPHRPGALKLAVAWTIFGGLGGVGFITFALPFWFLWLRWRGAASRLSLGLAAYAAVAVHGNYALLGLVAAPVVRYSQGMWPMLTISLVSLAVYLTETAQPDVFRHGNPPPQA